jgi:hypothetical protein
VQQDAVVRRDQRKAVGQILHPVADPAEGIAEPAGDDVVAGEAPSGRQVSLLALNR